jgi:integrase
MSRSRSNDVLLEKYSDASRPNLNWIVRWPSADPGGRRKEKRFTTKASAKTFKEQKEIDLLNKGAERAGVHGNAVDEAKWAIESLAPYGVSIRQAVQAFIDRHNEIAASVNVKIAVKQFIDSKERDGVSKRYLSDLGHHLRRFVESFSGRSVCDLTVAELDRWLVGLGLGPVSRNNARRNLGVFFEWCLRMSYCSANPMRRTSRAKKRPKPVEIFTAGELRVVLDHAPKNLLPALAIGAFAGLRVSEIARLDWTDINMAKGHIEVAAENSKSASRRFVPMNKALLAWVKPLARVQGPVTPHRLNELLSDYRGILKKEAIRNGIVDRPAVVWKHNVLRHSFASYAIASEQSADRVALWLGHTSAKMTFESYQERATEDEAAAWFAVLPAKVKAVRAKRRKGKAS